MFQTILQALVPVVFVAGLGWLVGRLGVLDQIVHEHVDPARTRVPEDLDRVARKISRPDDAGA